MSDPSNPAYRMQVLHAFFERPLQYSGPLELLQVQEGLDALRDEILQLDIAKIDAVAYRGRRFANESLVTEVTEFHAPPEAVRKASRFNRVSDPVLYLTLHEAALEKEVYGPGSLWAADFEIQDMPAIRLDPPAISHLPHLTALLALTDFQQLAPKAEGHPHTATQLVRCLIEAHGGEAIVYPSVTGQYSTSPEALNVAIISSGYIDKVERTVRNVRRL